MWSISTFLNLIPEISGTVLVDIIMNITYLIAILLKLLKLVVTINTALGLTLKGTVSRYIDKNRTGACGLGRNRRLLRHTELVFLSTVCARRVLLVLFTNMDAVN